MPTRRTFLETAAGALAASGAPAQNSVRPPAPVFPYGAVYFRKSNPPAEDWERDYQTAVKSGMNIFRHWFLWSAIEVAPGEYDWADYDRQLDLAARYGIRTIIAEFITSAPEWAFAKYPHARFEAHDGARGASAISGSSATGGFPGLCLDNEDVLELAGRFLVNLAGRYQDHPGLMGYDLWNECNTAGGGIGSFQSRSSAYIPAEHRGGGVARFYCYCPATQARFREWLKRRYHGDLRALGRAWHRYSYSDWEQVEAPRSLGGYPEWLDWLEFRVDRAHALLRWRRDLIRSRDRRSRITAHSIAYTLESHAEGATDEWRAAREVEVFGFTWVASRKGTEPWKQFHAVDLVRAGARGKPFWHAEAQAGPLWMQSEVTGRPKEDGRVTEPSDVRYWNLVSCAGGATGILYPRWRPLLDGPLFGAFGPFAMDGSPTPRSEMCAKIARWANANPQLWKSRPVQGDVAIAWVPESHLFNFVQNGNTGYYAESARGAYMAFFDAGLQPDFVHIEHIAEYPVVYLPFPLMLKKETAGRLRQYVEQGGILISEGCPGYFGDGGRAGTQQPNHGLDEVFGAREADVEFMPDLTANQRIRFGDARVRARLHRQVYRPTTGAAFGWYDDGSVAAVENRFGRGRTRLIGAFPGAAYLRNPEDAAREFYAGLLAWAGRAPHTRVSNRRLIARLHTGEGGTCLWVLNPARTAQSGAVALSERWGPFRSGRLIWGGTAPKVAGRSVEVEVGERDAVVVQLSL